MTGRRASHEEATARLAEARDGFRAEGNEVLAALATLYQAELALRRGEPRAALGAARRPCARSRPAGSPQRGRTPAS